MKTNLKFSIGDRVKVTKQILSKHLTGVPPEEYNEKMKDDYFPIDTNIIAKKIWIKKELSDFTGYIVGATYRYFGHVKKYYDPQSMEGGRYLDSNESILVYKIRKSMWSKKIEATEEDITVLSYANTSFTYVSPEGKDTNDGKSWDSSLKTISKAIRLGKKRIQIRQPHY